MNNQKTKYTIYWTFSDRPASLVSFDMAQVLGMLEQLREIPEYSGITFCAEHADQVGKMGVDSVVGKTLPNGEEYTWMKRRVT